MRRKKYASDTIHTHRRRRLRSGTRRNAVAQTAADRAAADLQEAEDDRTEVFFANEPKLTHDG
jgi:hypothetical protein